MEMAPANAPATTKAAVISVDINLVLIVNSNRLMVCQTTTYAARPGSAALVAELGFIPFELGPIRARHSYRSATAIFGTITVHRR